MLGYSEVTLLRERWGFTPFVHLPIVFLLYTVLPCRSSVVEFPGLLYFWGYFIKPCCFPFRIFRSTESSSSCLCCFRLMSSWLLNIFVISSCKTFGGFPSKLSKRCFYRCIRSSWLVAFCLSFAVLFILLTSFTVCHAIVDCLSSTESRILLIWFCMSSICSFRYRLVDSFDAFSSFWAFVLFGLCPMVGKAIFTSETFFLTSNISHRTLESALCLVVMNSAAVWKWALTKFSYASFRVRVSDISWGASNLFLSVNVYLSLKSLSLSRNQS